MQGLWELRLSLVLYPPLPHCLQSCLMGNCLPCSRGLLYPTLLPPRRPMRIRLQVSHCITPLLISMERCARA